MPHYDPTLSELASFSEGMLKMYSVIERVQPDVLLFPMRGAFPFYAAAKTIATLEGKALAPSLLLPVGTCHDVQDKAERGLTKPEKRQIFDAFLDKYFGANPSASRVLLVDEVMHGGTITEHYYLTSSYLRRNNIPATVDACAIEDGRTTRRGGYASKAERFGFHRVPVQALFTMDRPQFLPKIVKDGEKYSLEVDGEKLEVVMDAVETMWDDAKGVEHTPRRSVRELLTFLAGPIML